MYSLQEASSVVRWHSNAIYIFIKTLCSSLLPVAFLLIKKCALHSVYGKTLSSRGEMGQLGDDQPYYQAIYMEPRCHT